MAAAAKLFRTKQGKTQRGAGNGHGLDYQAVARVAYELYEQRGRADGHDFEDWLKAEELVRQGRQLFSRTLL